MVQSPKAISFFYNEERCGTCAKRLKHCSCLSPKVELQSTSSSLPLTPAASLAKSPLNRCIRCKENLRHCACVGQPLVKKQKPAGNPSETNYLQQALHFLGDLCVAVIALACGVSIAAAFVTLALVTAGTGSYILAALLFGAGFVMNWYIYRNSVPEVLVDMFGKESWFQGLFELPDGCEVLYSSIKPQAEHLAELDLSSNSAYVRYRNHLFYVNKARKECLELSHEDLLTQTFDDLIKEKECPLLDTPRKLAYRECQQISDLTGHQLLSLSKKIAMLVGVFLAIAVGMAQAVLSFGGTFTLSKAFAFLGAISPAFPAIAGVLAGVTLICLTALMIKNIAAWVKADNLWQDFKDFLSELVDFTPRCEVFSLDFTPNPDKLDLLPMETNAAYIKKGNHLYYVNKEHKECVEINDFGMKFVVGEMGNEKRMISYTEMEKLAELQKKHRLAVRHVSSRWALFASRALSFFMTLIAIPLAALGLYMTMNASAAGIRNFLTNTFTTVAFAVADMISKVITLGLAFLGRITFTLRNTAKILKSIFTPSSESSAPQTAPPVEDNRSWLRVAWDGFVSLGLNILCLLNAIGNGLISMVGGGKTDAAFGGTIFFAGFWNSFTAGKSNIDAARAKPKVPAAKDDSELYLKKKKPSSMRNLHIIIAEETNERKGDSSPSSSEPSSPDTTPFMARVFDENQEQVIINSNVGTGELNGANPNAPVNQHRLSRGALGVEPLGRAQSSPKLLGNVGGPEHFKTPQAFNLDDSPEQQMGSRLNSSPSVHSPSEEGTISSLGCF